MSKDKKKKRGGSSQEGPKKKKPKPKNPLMNKLLVDSQKKFFEGRRLLLKSKNIYKNKNDIPDGEEDYLWLYSVTTVNDGDCTLATLTFEKKYVEKGGTTFVNYHDAN